MMPKQDSVAVSLLILGDSVISVPLVITTTHFVKSVISVTPEELTKDFVMLTVDSAFVR